MLYIKYMILLVGVLGWVVFWGRNWRLFIDVLLYFIEIGGVVWIKGDFKISFSIWRGFFFWWIFEF